jgi:hypothetical protein
MRYYWILAVLVLLTACGQQSPEQRRYFEGYEGVDVRLSDPGSPPSTVYYYGDTSDNRFTVTAEVANEGSSAARGGLYLSGYDPNLIQVEGINPTRGAYSCTFNLFNIGEIFADSGSGFTAGGSVSCGENEISLSNGVLSVTVDNILSTLGITDRLNVDATVQAGNGDFNIDVDGNFDVGLRGAYTLLYYSGLDFSANFGREYILQGDTPDFPGGDIKVEDWTANINRFPPGLDSTRQNLLITNCYLYSTNAAPVVCIDPAPYSDNAKSCRPSNYNPTNGQGAPVAVTSIEQENTPRSVIFKINVRNQGDGEVWAPGSLPKCSPYQKSRVTLKDKNRVILGIVRVSGDATPLDCTPNRVLKLDPRTESGTITCKYDIEYQGVKSAYQTPLVVELWYGYEETIRRSVEIKRVT